MTKNSYFDRAERARDPRFARILGKLGYARRDMVAFNAPIHIPRSPTPPPPEKADLANLRDTYERVVGKRPFMGWDAAKLREKIAAAKSEG